MILRCLAAFTLLVFILLPLTGCQTLKKKFVRRKPAQVIRPVVFHGEADMRQYSNKYYYQLHFTQWRSWHQEILNNLGGNAKMVERAFDEAVGHLGEMTHYLEEPKRADLQERIDELNKIHATVEARGMKPAGTNIRVALEKSLRLITAGFYYDKVAEHVTPDVVDLSRASP